MVRTPPEIVPVQPVRYELRPQWLPGANSRACLFAARTWAVGPIRKIGMLTRLFNAVMFKSIGIDVLCLLVSCQVIH